MAVVKFWIHSDPTNSSSSVDIKVTFEMTEDSRDGDTVGWTIDKIQIFDEMASPTNSWTKLNPVVPTLDGLWWVKHDDPDVPTRDEFRNPPHMTGTANADDSADPDLTYDIEGRGNSSSTPWDVTALLSYSFKEIEQPTPPPIKEEDDEPVEVPDNTP